MYQRITRLFWIEGHPGGLSYLLLLVVIVGVHYLSLLTGQVYKTLHPDALFLHMPAFAGAARSLATGELPYWLPTHLAGLPLYNATHFTPLYPFYFLQWGLCQTPLACVVHFNRVIGFHLLLLSVNSFAMLRLMGIGRFAALAGAALTGCGGTVMVLASWANIIAPLSWMPLAIAGIHLILERTRKKPGIVLATLALAMIGLASPAQELIYTFYLIAGMGLFKIIALLTHNRIAEIKTIIRSLIVTAVLSFALVAPIAVAVLTDMSEMIRFAGDHLAVTGHERLPIQALLEGQIAPLELLARLFWPVQRLPVTGDPYLGGVTIGLIVFAFAVIRQKPFLWPFFFFMVYGLLSATGNHMGMVQINYHLPLLNKIREADRHFVWVAFCAPLLAAFGLEYLLATMGNRSPLRCLRQHAPLLSVFTFLLMLSVWAAFFIHADLSYGKSVLSLVIGVSLLVAGFFFIGKGFSWVWAFFFLCALFYPTLGTPLWAAFPLRQSAYLGVPLFSDAKNQASIEVLSQITAWVEKENYRLVYHTESLTPVQWAMNGAYFGLRSFESFFQPLPLRQHQEISEGKRITNYLQLMGGRYWVWENALSPPPNGFSLVKSFETVTLYRVDNALPHCYLSDGLTQEFQGREDFFEKVASDEAFHRTIYMEKDHLTKISAWLEKGRSTEAVFGIKPVKISTNTFVYRISCNKPALLILNEYFGPHWHAALNGKEVTPYRVNLNQIGVMVDSGEHLVRFEYCPKVFHVLLICSILSWGIGSLYLFLGVVRRCAGSKKVNQKRSAQGIAPKLFKNS